MSNLTLLAGESSLPPSSLVVSPTCWRDLHGSHERHTADPQWFHGLLYGTRTPQGVHVALVILQDELLDRQWKKLDDVHEHCLRCLGAAHTIGTPLPTVMTTPALRTFLPDLAPDQLVLLLLGKDKPDIVCYSEQLFSVLRQHHVHFEPRRLVDQRTPDPMAVP